MSEFGWDYAANTEFGMRWGPVQVIRAVRFPDGKGAALVVKTDHGEAITITVSEKGRVMKVFKESENVSLIDRPVRRANS